MKFIKVGGSLGLGIVVGMGVSILFPELTRRFGQAARPLLKESLKGGMKIVHQGKVIWAETRESLEDLVAEARSELSEGRQTFQQ